MGNFFSAYPDSRIVETAQGKVQGRRLVYTGDKQVDAFQGIPFAAPPIGPLRFKKPIPQEKWEGVRETKRFGRRAIVAPFFHWTIDNLLRGAPSEDCLTLNVFTPCWQAPESGFPVMVFIHGGGFEVGDAIIHGDVNICQNIVTRDVIFVTTQYRLGYLGFMSTDDSTCPGNLGLWDQTAALQWVNDNIEDFGGNKGNITVLGQSAGAASVDMLHLSPHSTNLFHKFIPMSGSAECRWASYKNMPLQCFDKARRLGITEWWDNEELLEKLRQIPAEQFEVKMMNRVKAPDADFETVPLPDGDFFPASFDELRRKAKPKPMMTGVAKEEGLMFIPGKKAIEEDLKGIIEWAIRDADDKEALAAELRAAYIDEATHDKERMLRRMANLASDYWFNAGAIEMCRKTVHEQDEPVFLYVFDHFNASVVGFMGRKIPIQDATHSSEGFYLFNKGFFSWPTVTDSDKFVMDLFTTAFTNFAKFGNPNGPNESKSVLPVYWKPLDKQNHSRNFVFSASNPRRDEEFFQGRTAKFVEIIEKHRT